MIVPERDSSKSFGALFKDQFGFSQISFSGYLKSLIFLFFVWWGICYNDSLSHQVIFTCADL